MARRFTLLAIFSGLLCALALVMGLSVGAPVAQAQEPLAGAFTTCAAQAQIPEAECLSLTALYTMTNGMGWTDHTNWVATDEPCGWYGVTCEAGHVTSLSLDTNGLSGHIPPALSNLSYLTSLSLGYNALSGGIPVELGSMSQLGNLFLTGNQLTGSIPPALGNLSNLYELFLSQNQLSGSIPPELGNLSNLIQLNLSYNQLTGAIPTQLGNLSNLFTLYLSSNQLSGGIPAELGALTNLTTLMMDNNPLGGAIPPALGNLSKVDVLDLSACQLTGSIPAELAGLTKLQGFWARDNQLTGSFPLALTGLTQLSQLGLHNNHLSGPLPPQLGNLTAMQYLWLSGNQFSGSIPAELGNLTSMQSLWLDSNQLSGEIPASLTNLTNLGYYSLRLGYNMLTASDPTLLAFLAEKAADWYQTQTVPPADVVAAPASPSSIQLTWTPIPYGANNGYYEISYSTTPGGPYTVHGHTLTKYEAGYLADGLTPGTPYYFVVRTFTPAFDAQQNDLWSAYTAEAPASTPAGSYLQRVNCGGSAYTDTKGNVWAADRLFGSGPWGAVGGSKVKTTSPIANTEDDPLYKTDRTWAGSARPGYRFSVPNGAYEITFKFAETLKTAVAQRKFTVRIEGIQVLTRYDIYSVAGAQNKAVADRTFVVNVTDGELDIEFIKVIDSPKINAIQIKQLTSYELLVNCGGSLYKDSAGKTWRSDKNYGPGSWGYTGGSVKTTTNPIANTVDDTLYQSERQWASGAAPAYRFAVPNGTYDVTFTFAETAYNAIGLRVFNVKLEGATRMSNEDIFAVAGGKNIAEADRTFSVIVTDGELTIDFIQVVGAPKVNAIRLKRTGD